MAYDLEEQEKIEELKAWWRRWGNFIIVTTTLALVVIAALRGWDAYQQAQARKAGLAYNQVLAAVRASEAQKVRELAALVREDYPRTVYASFAAFAAAKFHVERGDRAAAREALAWVAENGRGELKAIARVRLAQVLLDEQAYDEALKVLDGDHPKAFEAQFAAARGDIYAVQGKREEARRAYQAALAATPPGERTQRELLQFKLDGLGEA